MSDQLVQLSPNYPPQARQFYTQQGLDTQQQMNLPTYAQYLQRDNCGRASASQSIPRASHAPMVRSHPIAQSDQPLYPRHVSKYTQNGCQLRFG
jgi:hypothetical protein